VSPSADLVAGLFGARGSGKSYTVRHYLEHSRPPRVLAVDPMNDYGGLLELAPSLTELAARSQGERYALRWVPDIRAKPEVLAARFGGFCDLAYRRAAARRGGIDMIVDEGHLFTDASYAPPDWAHCTLLGRHVALRIWLCSQRPASIDKHFFTNATWLRTGRLNYDDDVSTMARALRVPRAAVDALIAREWIGRDMLTGALTWECSSAAIAAELELQAPRNATGRIEPPRLQARAAGSHGSGRNARKKKRPGGGG
jgi:hypothetical protein